MDSEGKSSHSSKSDEKVKKKKKKSNTSEKPASQNKKRPKKKAKSTKKGATTQIRTIPQYVIPSQSSSTTEKKEEGDKCDIAQRWDYLNSSTEADTAERLKWYKIHRRMRYQVAYEERKAQQLGIMGLENISLSKPPSKSKPLQPG